MLMTLSSFFYFHLVCEIWEIIVHVLFFKRSEVVLIVCAALNKKNINRMALKSMKMQSQCNLDDS